jgi:hypothetical protein
MIPVQKAVTDVQMVTSMLFCGLIRNRPCTNFVEMKPVVDDFTGRTMNNWSWFAISLTVILP